MIEFTTAAFSAQVLRYGVTERNGVVSRRDALHRLEHDPAFRRGLTETLRDAPFAAFRWETPALTRAVLDTPFEFVLVDAPWLETPPQPEPFAGYFGAASDDGIVVFRNLGGDAVLVVTAPLARDAAYVHLAAFVRDGPDSQVDALWRSVAATVSGQLDDSPLWLSTAGGGVAWLHVRLDSRPKYYAHRPYTCWPGTREEANP